MVKRLVALLFVFVIAGQVSAGVCGCLGDVNQPQHSCCKRQKTNGDSLRQKGCCDSECAMQQSERLPQDRTNATAKISFKAVVEPAALRLDNFAPVAELPIARSTVDQDFRLEFARPPELYLRHHAFLI
jgi:hypothetical protein